MNENTTTLASLAEGAVQAASPVMPTGNPVPLPKLNPNSVKEVDRREVALPSEKEETVTDTGNPLIDQAFENIDPTIERLRQESLGDLEEGENRRAEAYLDSDDDMTNTNNNPSQIVIKNVFTGDSINADGTKNLDVREELSPEDEAKRMKEVEETMAAWSKPTEPTEEISTDLDDRDFDDIFDEDEEDTTTTSDDDIDDDEEFIKKQNEIKSNIRTAVKNNFVPVHKSVDLSKFTIASGKRINAGKLVKDTENRPIECADSVLFAEKRPVRMSALSGAEIQTLDPQRLKSSNYNSYMRNKLQLIYDHIIDCGNKPGTFEKWAKTTPNTSLDDYYFAAYKATFGDSNIITYTCPDEKCNNVYMKPRSINDMIKFGSDKIKEEYYHILNHGDLRSDGVYKTGLFQASDKYVIQLKQPSLYNTFIETTLVDDEFIRKYENLLILISYIENIYVIDHNTNELIPVDYKADNNETKTYKRKIKTFATVIRALTSDQFQALTIATDDYDGAAINEDGEFVKDISYVFPSDTCPKCNSTIKEQAVTPDNMLFMRHQLGLMSKI